MWASKRLAVLVQANAPSGVKKKTCVGECHAQQLKHAIQDAWKTPGGFPEKGREGLSALKPSEIGLALDDISSLGVGSPIFSKLPSEMKGGIADAFLMKALSMVRGPLAAPLESNRVKSRVKSPWICPVAPSAASLAISVSSIPAPTKADFERHLGLLPEHSWASAPLMALSTRKMDLEEGHPDRRYLSLPQRTILPVPRSTLPAMEKFLTRPPVPQSASPATPVVDLTATVSPPPISSLEPESFPFRPPTPPPQLPTTAAVEAPQQISLLDHTRPVDRSSTGRGVPSSGAQNSLDVQGAAQPPHGGTMVAQLQLELATMHQLHEAEEEHTKRLQFEGDCRPSCGT